MFYALSWLLVFGLLGMWSLAAWGLHALAVWSTANAGSLAGPSAAIEGWGVPGWLAPWIPPEAVHALKSMLSSLAPLVEAVLATVPSLAGGLSVAIWVLWALGGVLLLLLGAALHALIALLRRGASNPLAPSGPRATTN